MFRPDENALFFPDKTVKSIDLWLYPAPIIIVKFTLYIAHIRYFNMFGLTIHTWGTPDIQDNEYAIPFFAEMFGSNPGHCALEMTLPLNKITEQLVKKYCTSQEGDSIIPHYQTKIFTGNQTRHGIYTQVPQDAIVVYFSFWPKNKLGTFEHDKRSERQALPVEYSNKGKALYTQKNGSLPKSMLMSGYYPFFTEICLGVDEVAVFKNKADKVEYFRLKVKYRKCHEEALQLANEYSEKSESYSVVEKEFSKSKKAYEALRLVMMADNYREEDFLVYKAMYCNLGIKLNILAEELNELGEKLEGAVLKRRAVENQLINYSSRGKPPDASISLPLDCSQSTQFALSTEKLLAKMRQILDSNKPFDFHWNNCSNTVRACLLEGTKDLQPTLQDVLHRSAYDYTPCYYTPDTPQKVLRFTADLQKDLQKLNYLSSPPPSHFKTKNAVLV